MFSTAFDILCTLQDSEKHKTHGNDSFSDSGTLLGDDDDDGSGRNCHKQSTAVSTVSVATGDT